MSYNAQWTQCTMRWLQCTMRWLQCTIRWVQCTMSWLQCTMNTIHNEMVTMHNEASTMHNAVVNDTAVRCALYAYCTMMCLQYRSLYTMIHSLFHIVYNIVSFLSAGPARSRGAPCAAVPAATSLPHPRCPCHQPTRHLERALDCSDRALNGSNAVRLQRGLPTRAIDAGPGRPAQRRARAAPHPPARVRR